MLNDIAVGIIISLLFISLIVVSCGMLIKIYIKKINEHNQKEIQFQKTLTATILETQEQLLNSISQDLHDDAGQQLTVINFQLENLKLDLPQNHNKLRAVSESVTQLSDSLRKISHALNPNWLATSGFLNAIRSETARINNHKSIRITTTISDDSNRKINPEFEIVIFRIFQETINNILKHAKATAVEINIRTLPKLTISIADNGQGFDVQSRSNTDSMGLKTCKSRAAMINFDYQISSKIDHGTTVLLTEN